MSWRTASTNCAVEKGQEKKWSGEWSVPPHPPEQPEMKRTRAAGCRVQNRRRGRDGRRRAAPGPQPFSLVVLARVISRGENPGGDVATDIAVEVVQITALSEWDQR